MTFSTLTSTTRPSKVLFSVKNFYCFNLFCRPGLHALSALPIPPLDMLGGLALPTRRSPDLRVQIFYLVLCSPPLRHARGLGLANLRVTRPVGSYLSYVCSSFNCLTLAMSIR
jgi:hypothetical protein